MQWMTRPAAAYTPLLLFVLLATSQCTAAQTSTVGQLHSDLAQPAADNKAVDGVVDVASLVCQPQVATPIAVPLQPVVISNSSWHAPALTPELASEARIRQQRERARTVRMAERAFYFGIDADNDALK